jgi:hypothetical protein
MPELIDDNDREQSVEQGHGFSQKQGDMGSYFANMKPPVNCLADILRVGDSMKRDGIHGHQNVSGLASKRNVHDYKFQDSREISSQDAQSQKDANKSKGFQAE